MRIYAPAGHMTLGGGLDGILGPNSVSGKIPSRLIVWDHTRWEGRKLTHLQLQDCHRLRCCFTESKIVISTMQNLPWAWSILIMASEGSRSWDWIRFILTPFISVIYLSSYFVEEFLNQSLFVLSRSARNFPKKRINWLQRNFFLSGSDVG